MSNLYIQFVTLVDVGIDPQTAATTLKLSSNEFDDFINQLNEENEANLKANFQVEDVDGNVFDGESS